MRYIDAEKLIKAIEEKGLDCSFALKMERLDTLALIDELQREQPGVDLKKEIKEWVNLIVGASFPEQDGDFISEEDYRSVIRQTALHFYELGLKARKEE